MKINSSGVSNTLNKVQQQQDNLLKKLAAARRINSAADDAAGLQIAGRLDSSVAAKAQGERNLYDGISLSRVYEQALQGINDNYAELGRLAVAAGNGIYGTQERQALQKDADALLDNAKQIINTTEFAGKKLFNADASLGFSTGTDSISLSTTDVGAALQNQNAFSLDLSSPAGAGEALNRIEQARNFISTLQAEAGAEANRFASAARSLGGQQVAESSARSRITDLDYARASADRAVANFQTQASVSVAMQARISSERALSLLS